MGGLICIAVPNFTKIGQTADEISHLTIFKMAAVRHLGFLKVCYFDQLISSGGPICAKLLNFIGRQVSGGPKLIIMLNVVKIGLSFAKILQFFEFSRSPPPPSWIFEIAEFYWLLLQRVETHKHAKFRKNRSIGCEDIRIFRFLVAPLAGARHDLVVSF